MDDPFKIQPQDDKYTGDPRDGVPEALRDQLTRLYAPGESIDIPEEIDQRLAQMARWRLSERVVASAGAPRGLLSAPAAAVQRRLFPMRLVTISAAAAALLLVVLLTPRLMKPGATPSTVAKTPGITGALRGDIDADGHVDIVDAFCSASSPPTTRV